MRIIRAVYGCFGILRGSGSGGAWHPTTGLRTVRIMKGRHELNRFAIKTISCVAVFLVGCCVLPIGAEDKLVASDEWGYDIFGYSAGLDGDTAVIGAPGNDDHGAASGSAYIFEWDTLTGTWIETIMLTASDAAVDDHFGQGVAISGDIVVVGAIFDDHTVIGGGSAYVFYRDHGGPDAWGEVAKLTASDAGLEDWFGCSVAIDGSRVVVGARQADGVGTDSGKAYIFDQDAGGLDNWSEVKILAASDAAADASFGRSTAVSGDTVVVGAHRDAAGGTDSGAAYVFDRDQGGAGVWGEVVKLTAADAAAEAYFGISAAIDGDLVLVGAFRDNGAALDSGAAYLFDRNLGGPDAWGQLTKFVPSDAAEDDRAGLSVDIRGATVVVGAGWHDAVADKAGAAYVFDRNRSGADAWGEVMKLTASDGVVDDFLGHSGVSIGDGRVILGAYGVDGPMGTNSGVAYIFGTPFFIDGFEDGTTDSWDAAIP